MSTLISGRHTVFSRNPQLAPISEQPLPLEPGEVLVVPAGHMVGVETGVEDEVGALTNYRALVVNAIEDLTITGPAYVTSPRAGEFDAILAEERRWVRKQMMKVAAQMLFIGLVLMLIAESISSAIQPYHHAIIAAVFLALAVGTTLFARNRLAPRVEEREMTP